MPTSATCDIGDASATPGLCKAIFFLLEFKIIQFVIKILSLTKTCILEYLWKFFPSPLTLSNVNFNKASYFISKMNFFREWAEEFQFGKWKLLWSIGCPENNGEELAFISKTGNCQQVLQNKVQWGRSSGWWWLLIGQAVAFLTGWACYWIRRKSSFLLQGK